MSARQSSRTNRVSVLKLPLSDEPHTTYLRRLYRIVPGPTTGRSKTHCWSRGHPTHVSEDFSVGSPPRIPLRSIGIAPQPVDEHWTRSSPLCAPPTMREAVRRRRGQGSQRLPCRPSRRPSGRQPLSASAPEKVSMPAAVPVEIPYGRAASGIAGSPKDEAHHVWAEIPGADRKALRDAGMVSD